VSSIGEIMDEERNAERLLRDAEQKAEALLKDARARAVAVLERAQSDDALVNDLTERHKKRIAALREEVLAGCQSRVAETEKLCLSNLDAAVKLIVDDLLGAGLEQ